MDFGLGSVSDNTTRGGKRGVPGSRVGLRTVCHDVVSRKTGVSHSYVLPSRVKGLMQSDLSTESDTTVSVTTMVHGWSPVRRRRTFTSSLLRGPLVQ